MQTLRLLAQGKSAVPANTCCNLADFRHNDSCLAQHLNNAPCLHAMQINPVCRSGRAAYNAESQFKSSHVSLSCLRRVEKGVLMVMIKKSEAATNNVKDVQID